jgi:hypothetical protein
MHESFEYYLLAMLTISNSRFMQRQVVLFRLMLASSQEVTAGFNLVREKCLI